MTAKDLKIDTVIVGMGNTGFSCARYFSKRGIEFVVMDSRENPPLLKEFREKFPATDIYTGGFDTDVLCRAKQILISPGVSLKEQAISAAVNSGVKVFGDIELFSRQAKAPIVAVTGSNGKSTVTTLVAEIAKEAGLKVAVGGNLGTPALDLLDNADTELYVLELSSFQLETVTSMNTVVSVVLNISEDHMDRYTSLNEYKAAKARIYNGDGTMVINLDDPLVASMQTPDRKVSGFTLAEPGNDYFGTRIESDIRWLVKGTEHLIRANELRIAGDHNIANVLASFAIAEALNLPRKYVCDVLRKFTGLPHRCQWVADINGVRWYDDSKGTNVGAAYAAIKGLAENRNIVLIAGGDGKGADFSRLADAARQFLAAAVLIGRDAPRIRKILDGIIPVTNAVDMDSAVKAANAIARPGDIVLLSPACASLDMFTDYRDRGQKFKESVYKLEKNNG